MIKKFESFSENSIKEYKVTIYVNTPYSTIVEASSEEEAKEIALTREGPTEYAFLEETMRDEWVAEGLLEFPNPNADILVTKNLKLKNS